MTTAPSESFPSPPRRVFLGWQQPFLPRVAAWLLAAAVDDAGRVTLPHEPSAPPAAPPARGERGARASNDRLQDLRGLRIVTSGARAGRRLLELLAREAASRRRPWIPPRISTAAGLLEELRREHEDPARPAADDFTLLACRAEALRLLRADLRAEFGAPDSDDSDGGESPRALLRAARPLHRLARELAREGLPFDDPVAAGALGDGARGRALRAHADATRALLEACGRSDPDLCDPSRPAPTALDASAPHVVLVAAVELPGALRRALRQRPVTAVIHAGAEHADGFDDLGALLPEYWLAPARDPLLSIPDAALVVADAPADQATATLGAALASGWGSAADGEVDPRELAVGVADSALAAPVARVFRRAGVPVHDAAGDPAARSLPGALLAATADVLDHRDADRFATLLRHPTVEDFLARRGVPDSARIIPRWGRLQAETLPGRIPLPLPARALPSPLAEAVEHLDRALAPFREPPRPLAAWAEPIAECLAEFFGESPLRREHAQERRTREALEALREILESMAALPVTIFPAARGGEAVELAAALLGERRLTTSSERAEVELLGWLELPLDDTPHLVVCGVHEDAVPGATPIQPLLPEARRRELGLPDARARLARDRYITALLEQGSREVRWVSGRRGAEGEPLLPSRILLAAAGRDLARRVDHLIARPPTRFALDGRPPPRPLEFPVPRPTAPEHPIDELSVTAFRDYLACPYRFWLRRVARLERVHEEWRELDPGAFGSLVHEVLAAFAQDERLASCTEPETVAAGLGALLESVVRRRHRLPPLPAVRLQVERARRRLRAIAGWQAQRAADGWRIAAAELTVEGAPFEVDGHPFRLRGRIDRVDVRESDGGVALLDYKTSDRCRLPEAVHRKGRGPRRRWVDLQLPLYRHLARHAGYTRALSLGYVLLPRDPVQAGEALATWSEAELAEADEVARQVVRDLRAGSFWPPADRPPPFSEDLEVICRDRLARAIADAEGDGPDESAGGGGA